MVVKNIKIVLLIPSAINVDTTCYSKIYEIVSFIG